MIKQNIRWGVLGATALVSASAFAPVAARADWRQDQNNQKNKNMMRNLAIGGAAVGAYGLLNHNSTLGLLGLAGGALAGSQYEKDRKQQSQDNSRDHWLYHRNNYDNNYNNSRDHGRYYDYGNSRDHNSYQFRHNDNVPQGHAYGWNCNHDNHY